MIKALINAWDSNQGRLDGRRRYYAMTCFKPGLCCIGSDCSVNCATIT